MELINGMTADDGMEFVPTIEVPLNNMMIEFNAQPSWNNYIELYLYDSNLTGTPVPVDVTIDWGDGYTQTANSPDTYSHVYANSGTHFIKVYGNELGYFGTYGNGVIGISNWGNLQIEMLGGVGGSPDFVYMPNNIPSSVLSLYDIFYQCSTFNDANIIIWDTGNVIDMAYVFEGATSFNQNISNWNTSNVTDMHGMFYDATSFNQDIGNWNLSNTTLTYNMFYNATSFNQAIGNWNVSNVYNMGGMFANATSFNQHIGNWNLSNTIATYNMFDNATSFNQDIGNWNVSNIYTMDEMFRGASSFNQDIGNWDVSNVLVMTTMFANAINFNQDLSPWCVTNIATEPTNFDTNTPAWVKPGRQPIWGTCPAPVPVTAPFELVWNLPPSESPGGYILNIEVSGNTYLNIDWGDGNVGNYVNPPGMTPMHTYSNAGGIYTVSIMGQTESIKFYGSTIMPHLTEVTSFGNLINLTSLWDCFPNASNLTIVPNTLPSSLSNLQAMFGGCTSLNDANIILWDTSNVTNMNSMFFNATIFNQNLSGWCVTNIVTEPAGFSLNSALTAGNKPVWGTCPP